MGNQRAIVDTVCKTGITNLATEIGALLGQELTCSDIRLNILSKESLFSDPTREITALAQLEVSGDQQGNGFLLTRLDSAITLGGILIMLPEEMIQESIEDGQLDGEMADAYGEVANIIAGVFTQAFVDKYPQTTRFIKKSVEVLVPNTIEMTSAQPFPPGNYYVASCTLSLADNSLGVLEFIVPAALFGLEESAVQPAAISPGTVQAAPAKPEPAPETKGPTAEEPAPEPPAAPAKKKPVFADAKKMTDVIFKTTINQLGEEIGALLGKDLVCDDIRLEMVKKADFFAEDCIEMSAMSQIKVTGESEGIGYLFVQIPDAIILGGTLIMLPEEQIEELAEDLVFDGEAVDAYGEVANILCGSLTQVFQDRYPKKLRFVRTETDVLDPMKLDPKADEPFPAGDYYLASCALHLEGHQLKRISLLFPGAIFDLYPAPLVGSSVAPASQATTAASTPIAPGGTAGDAAAATMGGSAGASGGSASDAAAAAAAMGGAASAPGGPAGDAAAAAMSAYAVDTPENSAAADETATETAPAAELTPIVLLISERQNEADPFVQLLAEHNCTSKVLTFQDDVKTLAQQHQLLGIFLIMSQVNEKGFATAIKLQALSKPSSPLIFAGPDWTRTTVMRAVKYGAKDILMLPASTAEIEEKISHHILKAS